MSDQLGSSKSILEGTTTSATDSWWLKTRIDSSTSGSCSGSSSHINAGKNKNAAKVNTIEQNRDGSNKEQKLELMDDTEDPFAFDEDDFEPSKWDLLSGKQKVSRAQNGRATVHVREDRPTQSLFVLSQQESSNNNTSSSCKASCSSVADEEIANLLADCLLTAVKVICLLTYIAYLSFFFIL